MRKAVRGTARKRICQAHATRQSASFSALLHKSMRTRRVRTHGLPLHNTPPLRSNTPSLLRLSSAPQRPPRLPRSTQTYISSVPNVNQSKCAITHTPIPTRHTATRLPEQQSLLVVQDPNSVLQLELGSAADEVADALADDSCRGATAAYAAAGSAMKSARIDRRMIVGTVRYCFSSPYAEYL
jgi:hypothetical protein